MKVLKLLLETYFYLAVAVLLLFVRLLIKRMASGFHDVT